MEIKLIAIDLDGTTMNQTNRLPERNRLVLKKALDSGIFVVPATGRTANALPEELKNIGISYAVTSNGARVVDLIRQKTVCSALLDRDTVKALIDVLAPYDPYLDLYIEGKAYAETRFLENPESYGASSVRAALIKRTRTAVKNLTEFLFSQPNDIEKININLPDQETTKKLWDILKSNDKISLTTSLPRLIEVSRYDANKATGLQGLCEYLHILPSQVMAIGDSYNDIPMLNFAGFSCAMENGEEIVKKQASFITLSNDDCGVAYAIEKFCL